MLETIKQATTQLTKGIKSAHQSTEIRLNMAKKHFGKTLFRRKYFLEIHNEIFPQTATKDLAFATRNGLLEKTGESINTKYRFK